MAYHFRSPHTSWEGSIAGTPSLVSGSSSASGDDDILDDVKATKNQHKPRKAVAANAKAVLERARSRKSRLTEKKANGGFLQFYKPTTRQRHIAGPEARPASSLEHSTFGGLRQDPFSSFPAQESPSVNVALDYFIQHYVPDHMIRPFAAIPGVEQYVQTLFQHLIMQNAGLFEAVVAQSQADLTLRGSRTLTPTKDVTLHLSNALHYLQIALASKTEQIADATFFCIIFIMGTHFTCGQFDQHAAHLKGLWTLVDLRGGIDNLGWGGTLKRSILMLSGFTSFAAQEGALEPAETEPQHPPLTYEKFPYPTSFHQRLATLPEGIASLALDGKLSLEIIEVCEWISDKTKNLSIKPETVTPPTSSHPPEPTPTTTKHIYSSDKILEILKAPNITETQRTLSYGLLAYTVRIHPNQPRNSTYDPQLKTYAAILAQQLWHDTEPEHLFWAIYCVAALREALIPGDREWFYHAQLKTKRQSWKEIEIMLKRFFWDEGSVVQWRGAWEEAVLNEEPP